MPLALGTRIEHYEIVGLLGAGGMGEVYRGRDTRLDRDVAIKILPDVFAADPERRARFAREAKTLAALNHPHIAQIHGFEESGETSALVMELVDGEDLSTRIRRGPIPFEEALPIARQIADALAAAHDQGIIHRDLKPGNIKVCDDGSIKVLDFGLAKALDSGSAIHEPGPASDAANSPTITTPAMTLRGVILGTAAYMAPEQAKGRAVDKRADIWAFGCVLYEMLTGRRAFSGDDVSDTLATVLKSDADLTGVPNAARRLIRKCLEKDPRRRLQDIRDAWDLLDDTPQAAPAGSTRWLPWAVAAIAVVSAIALAVTHFAEQPAHPESARFQIQAPEGHAFDIYLVLSPDGRRLAFTARDQRGIVHLWVRDLESLQARQLPGTEGAWSPFWSPDGRYLGFGVDQLLKKIDVASGPPQTIAKSDAAVGLGAWGSGGTIVFGSRGNGPLRRVSASGGTPAFLTEVNTSRTERFHSFPVFLADGRHFLYLRQSADPERHGIYVGSLDTAPDRQPLTRVAHATMGPIAVTEGPGGPRVLFPRDGNLMVQRFDVRTLTTSDESTVIAEQLGSSGSFSFFTASPRVLAYRTGGASGVVANQLTWLDRKGQIIERVGEPGAFVGNALGLALSPDARHAVVGIFDTANPDLWLLEFARGIRTRLTFNDATDIAPVWSADGSRLAFRSSRIGKGFLYVKDIAGTSDESLLVPSTVVDTPSAWSHDGRLVVFVRGGIVTADLWAVAADGKSAPVPLLESRFAEIGAAFSPDDRWLAYASNESGDHEVYVRSFAFRNGTPPALGPKWRVSTDGGLEPRWRRDGKELFYRSRSGAIMAAEVTISNDKLETGIPRQLFVPATGSDLAWGVAPDGQRFLVTIPAARPTNADPITVALNWQQ